MGATSVRLKGLAQIVINRESQRIDRISDLVQALHLIEFLPEAFPLPRNENGEIVQGPVPLGSAISSETASSLIVSTVTESHLRQIEETND